MPSKKRSNLSYLSESTKTLSMSQFSETAEARDYRLVTDRMSYPNSNYHKLQPELQMNYSRVD